MTPPPSSRDEWNGVPLLVVLILMLVLIAGSLTLAACQPDPPCAVSGAASCAAVTR